MTRISIPLALIGTICVLLVVGAAPVYAADCPQPDGMIPVTIDVKPGSYPNPVGLNSEGLIPVALLGIDNFSVANVDLGTVRFHPMDRCEQAATPKRYASADINNDGYTDIIFHFKTKEVGFLPGDTGACLHGTLLDAGGHFCGHDAIVVIG